MAPAIVRAGPSLELAKDGRSGEAPMKRLRLSIGGLMAAVSFIAVGIAALRGNSVLWASATFTIALASCLGALLGSLSGRGAARMAWGGFTLFAGSYLALAFGPLSEANGVTAPPFLPLALHEPLKDTLTPRPFNYGGRPFQKAVILDPTPSGESFYDEPAGIFVPDGQALANATGVGNSAPNPSWSGVSSPPGAQIVSSGTSNGMILVPDGTGAKPPPGLILTTVSSVDYLQLRRILHALGAIAFGLVGAGIGWGVAARSAPERRTSTG